jgi:hypothetical protein
MIKCEGDVAVPKALSSNTPEEVVSPQPVETLGPSVNVLSEATVISRPELAPKVPEVWPVVNEKLISLTSCPTLVGFGNKSEMVTVKRSAAVVNLADAFTGS